MLPRRVSAEFVDRVQRSVPAVVAVGGAVVFAVLMTGRVSSPPALARIVGQEGGGAGAAARPTLAEVAARAVTGESGGEAGGVFAGVGAQGLGTLRRVARVPFAGAEIVEYDAGTNTLLCTGDAGVAVVHLGTGSDPVLVRVLDVAAMAGFTAEEGGGEVTHVAVDPAGRGFAAASVVPRAGATRATRAGRVVFFSTRSGAALGAVEVGHVPDAVRFTPDGSRLLVANEGEPVVGPARKGSTVWDVRAMVIDPPGSVSAVMLDRFAAAEDLRRGRDPLTQRDVVTVYPSSAALAAGLGSESGAAVRIHPYNRHTPVLDLEPESIAVMGDTAYVTFQENNAVGVFDVRTLEWVSIRGLGAVETRVDGSDRDGGAKVASRVWGMPMPDQIAVFEHAGRRLLVMPGEGDDRGKVDDAKSPLADAERVRDLAAAGRLAVSAAREYDLSDAGIGRLHVCAFSGDTTGDGKIDRPTMLGTRSVLVYDAGTMELVGHTGEAIERAMAALDGGRWFNADSTRPGVDTRSDDRGPEPEGIVLGEVRGRPVAFVGLERPGALAVVDLSEPERPRVVDVYVSAAEGDMGPEGLAYIPAGRSPSGRALVVAAFEVSGTVVVYEVAE